MTPHLTPTTLTLALSIIVTMPPSAHAENTPARTHPSKQQQTLPQGPEQSASFVALSGLVNFQMGFAEVDWVPGYRPTPEEAMRDNNRAGVQLRAGMLTHGRFKVGLSFSYHGRLPKGEVGYGLFGLGFHVALQDDPANRISWGGGLDVEKLFSTTDAVDASDAWRIFPHLVWDFYLVGSTGKSRQGPHLRVGVFVELGGDGPAMTEMNNEFVLRPQLEFGWTWASS
ncbi:MAG: hypothetical protein JRH20_24225 [Deltaproteobacteria bacterium]|nr:hypothetical protein [Deltaproteobacteria bacterium]